MRQLGFPVFPNLKGLRYYEGHVDNSGGLRDTRVPKEVLGVMEPQGRQRSFSPIKGALPFSKGTHLNPHFLFFPNFDDL